MKTTAAMTEVGTQRMKHRQILVQSKTRATKDQHQDQDQDPADQAPADQDPADQDPADQDPADQDPADQDPAGWDGIIWEETGDEMDQISQRPG